MGFGLMFQIEGDVELARVLRVAADKIDNWTPAFEETAITLKKIFSEDVFKTQGAIIEENWSPLSKAYAYRKAKKYPGKGILEASGTMKAGFMTMFRNDMTQIWNEISYFKYHQSNQPRTKMPRRVMMKLAEAQRVQVVRIFQKYFLQVTK
jgi:phage gpG-like protein